MCSRPSQRMRASKPSASASSASRKRRIVDAATPTRRAKSAQLGPWRSRSASVARKSPRTSNRGGAIDYRGYESTMATPGAEPFSRAREHSFRKLRTSTAGVGATVSAAALQCPTMQAKSAPQLRPVSSVFVVRRAVTVERAMGVEPTSSAWKGRSRVSLMAIGPLFGLARRRLSPARVLWCRLLRALVGQWQRLFEHGGSLMRRG